MRIVQARDEEGRGNKGTKAKWSCPSGIGSRTGTDHREDWKYRKGIIGIKEVIKAYLYF